MENSTASQFFGYLFSIRDKAHLAHLKASGPGAYAAHNTLGEFYDSLLTFTDELIEVYQGIHGITDINIPSSTFVEPLDLLEECRSYIKENRSKVSPESHFQNIVDEVMALIDRTIYKLENLK